MKISEVLSSGVDFLSGVSEQMKGEKYGVTIGEEIKKGKSLEEGIRIAYNTHGIILESDLSFSVFTKPYFVTVMGGVLGGLYGQKLGFFNQKLWGALVRVSQEMTEDLNRKVELGKKVELTKADMISQINTTMRSKEEKDE